MRDRTVADTRRVHRLPGFVLVLSLLWACATPVGVEEANPRELGRELSRSILTGDTPSARSFQLLDRLDLIETWHDQPEVALEIVRRGLGGMDTSARLLGLAELSFAHADRQNDLAWYRAAALAAWAYLFPEGDGPTPNAFDPGLRLAAEIYNRGLALGFPPRAEADLARMNDPWPLPYGEIEVRFDRSHLGWAGYRLTSVVPNSSFRVRGLRNRHRRVGIGAPLSARVVRLDAKEAGHRIGEDARVPLTALLRVDQPVSGISRGRLTGSLEIYVMDQEKAVQIDGAIVPLEFDPTVALAFGMSDPAIWSFELGAFFSGESRSPFRGVDDGLVLLHPHRRGRVPVVFVHGTASSPGRWAEMVNELQGDPDLADRVEVWLFFYNTGNPILYSASRLRRALQRTVATIQAESPDRALQNMVVIGHSQGGLLTRLQAVDAESAFWDDERGTLEELRVSDEAREMLRAAVKFDALPFVSRVIYIATPHQGSYQATRTVARWVGNLITLPLDLTLQVAEVVTDSDTLRTRNFLERMPTSLDNMTPGDPFLDALATRQERPGVAVHSIVASQGDGLLEGTSDGVVAYKSAHRDGVDSELVVKSGHSVQGAAQAIAEVRRLLHLHVQEIDVEDAALDGTGRVDGVPHGFPGREAMSPLP